jgi:hypothetical protein
LCDREVHGGIDQAVDLVLVHEGGELDTGIDRTLVSMVGSDHLLPLHLQEESVLYQQALSLDS